MSFTMFAYDNGEFIMLDNKNNKYYGVDSGCGSPQNWGNLQSAYSLRSHQSWWTSKGVKGAVLGLGLATLLPLTNAFAADPVDVTISGWNPGNAIHLPYGTEPTSRNTGVIDVDGSYMVTVTDINGNELDLTNNKDGEVKFNVKHISEHYNASGSAVDTIWLTFIPADPNKYRSASTENIQTVDLYVDQIPVTFAGEAGYPNYSTDRYAGKYLRWSQGTYTITYGDTLASTLNSLQWPKDAWTGRTLDAADGYPKFTVDGIGSVDGNRKLNAGTDGASKTYTLRATFKAKNKDGRKDGSNYSEAEVVCQVKVNSKALSDDQFKLSADDLKTISYGTWFTDYIVSKASGSLKDKQGAKYKVDWMYWNKSVNPNRWDVATSWGVAEATKDKEFDKQFTIAGKTDTNCFDGYPDAEHPDVTLTKTSDQENFSMGKHSNLRITFYYDNYQPKEVWVNEIEVVKAIPVIHWPARDPEVADTGVIKEKLLANQKIGDRLNADVEYDPVNGVSLTPRVYETDEELESKNYTLPALTYTINGKLIGKSWKTSKVGDYTIVATYDIGKRNPERDYYFGEAPAYVTTEATLTVYKKASAGVVWDPVTDLTYGQALNKQNVLNATAEVDGKFTYTPDLGTVLDVGIRQPIQMTFVPADESAYNTVTETKFVTVHPVLPTLKWNPQLTYGQDSKNKLANVDAYKALEGDEETFTIKYGIDEVDTFIETNDVLGPDNDDYEFIVIDNFDLEDGESISTAIQKVVDELKTKSIVNQKTVFVIGYDFTKGDNLAQYMGSYPPVGKYKVPVHFMAVGLKSYRFLNTITPEDAPYTGIVTVKKYTLTDHIGWGEYNETQPDTQRNGRWDKQSTIEIKYGEIAQLQAATNACFAIDAFGVDHNLAPWKDKNGWHYDNQNKYGTISYEIWSGAKLKWGKGSIHYNAEETAKILRGEMPLPVNQHYDADGNLTADSNYRLWAIYNPADKANYEVVRDARTLIVNKQDVAISWIPDDSIFYGELLTSDQLNAVFTTDFLGNANYAMNGNGNIQYSYRSRYPGKDEPYHAITTKPTIISPELDVVDRDSWDYYLRVVYTPNDTNNYNGVEELREFAVYPAPLSIKVDDKNVANKTPKADVEFTANAYTLQFDDVLPTLTLDAPDASVDKNGKLNQGTYDIVVMNENDIWGWDRVHNYDVQFISGYLYVGLNPTIVWKVEKDATITDSYADYLNPTALDPKSGADITDQGEWTYTDGDTEITKSDEIGKPVMAYHTLYATFKNVSGKDYRPSTSKVQLWVKELPVLGWDAEHASTTYGVLVTRADIENWARVWRYTDKDANIKSLGKIEYTWAKDDNPEKKIVDVGTYDLTLKFIPSEANAKNYAEAKPITVSVKVTQAIPQLTWNPKGPIVYGTKLTDADQLNATVSGPQVLLDLIKAGKIKNPNDPNNKQITYTVQNPPMAGTAKMEATYQPANSDGSTGTGVAANFGVATAEKSIEVLKANVELAWVIPNNDKKVTEFKYGDSISGFYDVKHPVTGARNQGKSSNYENDKAPVYGHLDEDSKNPKEDAILPAGTATLTVVFVPDQEINFNRATLTRTFTVHKVDPNVTPNTEKGWTGAIEYGDTVSGDWFDVTGIKAGVALSGTKKFTVEELYYKNPDKHSDGVAYRPVKDDQGQNIDPTVSFLPYNVDAADYNRINPNAYKAPYRLTLTFTPNEDDDEAKNYKTKSWTYDLTVNPTLRMQIYPLDENGKNIDGNPIERFWNHNGVDFTAMVEAQSLVEKGRVLEGEYTMKLWKQQVEAAATAMPAGDPDYTITWTTNPNDASTKAAQQITDVPSAKYHIEVTFTAWGYPYSEKYADKGINDSNYDHPYTRATDVTKPADVFLLYIDPAVYIKTGWDAKGDDYSDSGTAAYPHLNKLLNPLVITYTYLDGKNHPKDHTFKKSDLKPNAIDAETYARDDKESKVEGTWNPTTKIPATWTYTYVDDQTGETISVDQPIQDEFNNLKPGEYTFNLEFTADWDAYRHYFDGVWTKQVIIRITREDPVAVWKPEPMYYGTKPGNDQRNGVADVPGSFIYPEVAPNPMVWPTTVGIHKVMAIFKPEDMDAYETVLVWANEGEDPEGLVILPEQVITTWAPLTMKYGQKVSDAQHTAQAWAAHRRSVRLDGTEGEFVYPDAEWPTEVGQHTVVAIFEPYVRKNYVDHPDNPGHDGDYPIRATTILTIEPTGDYTFTWEPTPTTLHYDDAFVESQFEEAVTSSIDADHIEFYCDDKPIYVGAKVSDLGLEVGTHTMKAFFVPKSKNYTAKWSDPVTLTVIDGAITIEWTPEESTIAYNKPLDDTYLNAKAFRNGQEVSEQGEFKYAPKAGTTAEDAGIEAGEDWTLGVTFTLGNESKKATATIKVTTSEVELIIPTDPETEAVEIYYGQLIATDLAYPVPTVAAAEPIAYTVAPVLEDGTVGDTLTKDVEEIDEETGETVTVTVNVDPTVDFLPVGLYELTAVFTPEDESYVVEPATALLNVSKTTPDVWMQQSIRIPYNTELDEDNVDFAAANPYNQAEVTGTPSFSYEDAEGNPVEQPLPVGGYTVTLTLHPDDSANYTDDGKATGMLYVGKATPVITWNPETVEFNYGATLTDKILNAETDVAGGFSYLLNGEPVDVGTKLVNMIGVQELTAVFTPDDTTSYTSPRETIDLVVYNDELVVLWSPLTPIAFGTPLSDDQLNAQAWLDAKPLEGGKYEYNHKAGEVLPMGTTTLMVVYTATNGDTAVQTATIEVVAATVNVTAKDQTITYGAAIDQTEYTVDPDGAPVTVTLTADKYDVGTYEGAIKVSATPADPNYTIGKLTDGTLTVTQATPTVKFYEIIPGGMSEVVEPIELDYGEILQLNDDDTITIISGVNNGVVESASEVVSEEPATELVETTYIVVATGIEGELDGKVTYTLDGVDLAKVEQPLDPKTYTLTAAFAPADDNYAAGAEAKAAVIVSQKADPEFVVTPTIAALNVDDTLTLTVTTLSDGAVTTTISGDALKKGTTETDFVAVKAGNATITVTLAETEDYLGATAEVDVVVSSKPVLTVKMDDVSAVYGTEPEFTWTVSSTEPIVGVEVTPVCDYSDVGTYPIDAKVAAPASFDVVVVKGTLTVTPVGVTVTALDQTITIGEQPDPNKYTIDPQSAAEAVSVSLVFVDADKVGTHPIKVTAATNDANYTIGKTVDATLTVTKKDPIQVTVTAVIVEEGMTYGDNVKNYLDYTVEPQVAGTLIYVVKGIDNDYIGEVDPASNEFQTLPYGTYSVTPKFTPTPVEGEEYVVNEVSVELAVAQAALTVTAGNAVAIYGDPNSLKVGDPTIEGLIGDDTVEYEVSVDYQPDYAVRAYPDAVTVTLVGEYPNYDVTYVNGTLDVLTNTGAASVVWNVPETMVYGTPIECNAKAYVFGEEVKDAEVKYFLDGTVEIPADEPLVLIAGKWNLKAVFVAPVGAGYTDAETSIDIEVTPKALTVTLDDAEVVYGELLTKLPEVKIEGLLEGDMVEYDVTSIYHAGTTPAGTYKDGIIATLVVGSDNYTAPEQVTSTLTVKKATQEVLLAVNPTVLNVGESATATAVTTSGLAVDIVISDTSILSQNLVALKVGTVTVIAKQAGDNNYEPAESDPVIVTVAPKADVQITWEPKSPIAYGTILSAEHLNATASLDGQTVEGHFYYNPTFGYVVTPESRFVVNGKLRLSATFVPTDRKRFKNAYIEVLVDIETEDATTDDDGEEAPALTISKAGSAKGLVNAAADALVITFTGTLEESTDGVTWTPVVGAEDGTYVVDVKVANQKFYRSVK